MAKTVRKTFSVNKKTPESIIGYKPNKSEEKQIKFFSELLGENFSMSEELAKAIGTVVVQALTENAKNESALDLETDGDDGLSLDLGDEDLPESKRDAGEVEEAEGPQNAPDLSKDFAELKKTMSNHSVMNMSEADKHYITCKEIFFNE